MRTAFLAVLLSLAALPAFAQKLYVHLTAVEANGEATVQMTLPFALVSRIADFLATADLRGGCHVRIDDHDFDVEDLRTVVAALRAGDEGVIETSRHEKVTFRVVADQVEIVAEDAWDRTAIRIPRELFYASFDEDGDIDFRAALEILEKRGEGEILIASEDESSVRVWVDRSKTISGGAR